MTLNQTRSVCTALKAHGGSIALTAAALGLSRDLVAAIAAQHMTGCS